MMHFPWRWLRWGIAAAVLAAVVWRTGTGPFIAGMRALDLGVATGTASGVIVSVAGLPGAIVLVRQRDAGRPLRWFRRCPPSSRLAEEGEVHG